MRTILKDIREQAGISQNQLAQWSGVSASLIQKLENGQRSMNKVSLEIAYKFAVILQTPVEVFINVDSIPLNPTYKEYHEEIMSDILLCYEKKLRAQYVKYTEEDEDGELHTYGHIEWKKSK